VDEDRSDQSPVLVLLGNQIVLFRSKTDQHSRVRCGHRKASGEAHQYEYSGVDADEDHRKRIRAREKRLQKSALGSDFVLGRDCFDRTKAAVNALRARGRRPLIAAGTRPKSGIGRLLFQEFFPVRACFVDLIEL